MHVLSRDEEEDVVDVKPKVCAPSRQFSGAKGV